VDGLYPAIEMAGISPDLILKGRRLQKLFNFVPEEREVFDMLF
jgi:hypothetical protein